MSNDLTLIATDALPDYLRSGGLQYEDAGVGAGITPRAPRLGITTDKMFTITKDNATMQIPRDPNGVARVRAVMIAGAQNITKAWYAKSFVPGAKEAPDCFSNDGVVPAPGVKSPQCQNCASCQKNAFGSHPVTGRGKACADRKMIVLVWEGLPDELITFNAPTMTLQNLKKIDTELRNANIPLQSVMLELTFDPAITYPVVKIAAIGFVSKDTAVKLIERSKTAEISELLRETDFDVADSQNNHHEQPLVPAVEHQLGGGAAAPLVTEQAAVVGGQEAAESGRRKRATKAEMEARRAAEAAKATGGSNVVDLINLNQPAPEPKAEMSELEKLQAQLAALQAQQAAPAETPEERQIRELKEQLAKAQQTVSSAAPVQQEAAPVQAQQAAQTVVPAAAGGMNVQDLLNKWKS